MLIGISGKRGVGKTTFAKRLVSVHGFKKISFADKLKEYSKVLVPFTEVDFSVSGKEKPYFPTGETPRDFLIKLGQFMRFYDPLFWVKAANIDKAKGAIVIDDVRFLNEVNYIKDRGGQIIRIERYKKDNPYIGELDDPSETELDNYKDFDFTVPEYYNQNIIDLNKQVDFFVKNVLK